MAKKYIMKCGTANFSVKLNSVTIKIESNYLLNSRKKQCGDFLCIENPTEQDILEFLLSLHFVLEVGINSFFRSYYRTFSNYDFYPDSKEIDSVDFLDKIRLFLSCNKFNLINGDDVSIAHEKAQKIPGRIMNFNNIRNMIVHGHSVSEISGEYNGKSKLKSKLNKESLEKQIKDFKEIISDVIYFIDRLDTNISREQISVFKESCLNLNFLDIKK